ncbi:MAG TPA: M48 family metallopeptidase [Bacillota bacterium]|nr:M48 family metallopeptidase [Bacillota bacterium]
MLNLLYAVLKWSLVLRLLFALSLITLNPLFAWGVACYGRHVYRKINLPEEALSRMGKLFGYLRTIILLITMLPASMIIYFSSAEPFDRNFPDEGFIGLLVVALIGLTFLVKACQRFIIHRTVKSIRGTTAPFKKQFGIMLRSYTIVLIPLIVMVIALLNLPERVSTAFWSQKVYPVSMLAAYIVFLRFLTPLTIKFVRKTVPLGDEALLERLKSLFFKAGLKEGKIRVLPAVGSKIANAGVTSFFRGNIFLTDYMINSLTPEEIEAIFAHELGHLKKGHLWVRLFASILWAPLYLFFDRLATAAHMEVLSFPYLISIIIFFVFYFRIVLHFLSRIQERQADCFVLKMGIPSITMISALYKIARLNHIKLKPGKIDERLQSHPSIERRIKWLMMAGNLSEGSVDSLPESNIAN